MKIRIDKDGVIHCPRCDAVMRKLYWRNYSSLLDRQGFTFTSWYGCTDCGNYVYDKHEDVVLSQFKEKPEK